MPTAYPGSRARAECAIRTREELLRYAPARPLAFRDELRLKVMHARCANCGACPLVIRALGIMSPSRAVETAEVVALKLAS